MPEVVRALHLVGIDNPEVFLRPVYDVCPEGCGGWDERLVSVTGGHSREGRHNHARACERGRRFRDDNQNGGNA